MSNSINPMRTITLALMLYSEGLQSQTNTFSKIFSNYPLTGENGWMIEEVGDGYFALSWAVCFGDPNEACAMLTKMNPEGDILWFKQYPFYPGGLQCMVVDNNLMYISGFNGFVGVGEDQYFILYCLDLEGNVLWNRTYGDSTQLEVFPNLSKIHDGNLVLYGSKYRNTEPSHYVDKLVKVDLLGNLLWERDFGWQFDWNSRENILPENDGGYTISYNKCDIDTICGVTSQGGVTRLNAEGEEVWSLTLPSPPAARTPPYIAHMDGGIIAAYWQQVVESIISDPAHYFIDSTGAIVDTQLLYDDRGRYTYGIAGVPGKGMAGTGVMYMLIPQVNPLGGRVYFINKNRDFVWERMYNDPRFDSYGSTLYNIIPTSDDGFMAIGTIINNMTGVYETHSWILKLDSMGCLVPGCSENTIITDTKEAVFLQAEGVVVWPNPASQWVSVAFPPGFRHDARDRLLLLSAEGRSLRSVPVQADVEHLLLPPELAEGIFYLVLQRGNEVVFSKKMVKSRP
ncbi:MAG: hypothetical protein ACKVT2_11625 [Saprospiraceae bacterium]